MDSAHANLPLNVHLDANTLALCVNKYFVKKNGVTVESGPLLPAGPEDWHSHCVADAESAVAELPGTIKKLFLAEGKKFDLVVTLPGVIRQMAHRYANGYYVTFSDFAKPLHDPYFRLLKACAENEAFKRGPEPSEMSASGYLYRPASIALADPVSPTRINGENKTIRYEFRLGSCRRNFYHEVGHYFVEPRIMELVTLGYGDAVEEDFSNLGARIDGGDIIWEPATAFAKKLHGLLHDKSKVNLFLHSMNWYELAAELWSINRLVNQGKAAETDILFLAAFESTGRAIAAFDKSYGIENDLALTDEARRNGTKAVLDHEPRHPEGSLPPALIMPRLVG